jgi:hypothetical protein
MTIDSLPSDSEMLGGSSKVSVHAGASSASLVVGFVISLAGLAMATIGPAVMFVRARRA